MRPMGLNRLFSSTTKYFSESHNLNVINFVKALPEKFKNPLYNPKRQRGRDSFVQEFLRFKSVPETYSYYKDWTGSSVRIGKILEDMDALAGMISFSHAVTSENIDKIQLVTASLDRIEMLSDIRADEDIRLSGMVTFVGKSSMEVSIKLETVPNGAPPESEMKNGYEASFEESNGTLIMTAQFTMVALCKNTLKAMPIEQLHLETNEDKELFELGAERKARKMVAAQFSLEKTPPTVEEMYAVHDIYLKAAKYHVLPKDSVWMHDSEQKALVLTHHQQRNINNKIFGGYLMRIAYEHAYATALLTTKNNIKFISLDDITFKAPVEISTILSLKSRIVYTKGNQLQVEVIADVIDYKTGERKTTNDFYFTFESEKMITILPKSYAESVAYIEGKRRYIKGSKRSQRKG